MCLTNRVVALCSFLFCSAAVQAAAPATVDVVQAPAWLDRGGMTQPLAAGMELKSGDVVRTGPGARAYLMLAEGSRVKLGESARFALHTRSLKPEKVFRGALDVLAGAFRFTTNKLKTALPRDVAIRVGTATIGIRGTDLWGRTDKNGDLVALLEGRIDVSRGGETTALTTPLTYFDAPRGQASAVKTLDPEVFKGFARQTEILPGDGAAHAKGKWRLLVASTASEETALEMYDQIRDAGYAARVRPRAMKARAWGYDVQLGGFSSAVEAEVAAARLQEATGLKPSVVR